MVKVFSFSSSVLVFGVDVGEDGDEEEKKREVIKQNLSKTLCFFLRFAFQVGAFSWVLKPKQKDFMKILIIEDLHIVLLKPYNWDF